MKTQQVFAKKGQFTLFIVLGIMLIIAAFLFFLVTNTENNSLEIVEIESLSDAKKAIEWCMEEKIEETLVRFRQYGGYTTENRYSFSSFATSETLLSLEELEENFKTSLERELNDCEDILENTPYELESAGRVKATVDFSEKMSIHIDSLGEVQTKDAALSEALADLDLEKEINLPEMHSILNSFLESEAIPVLQQEKYIINTFTNEEYTEVLIEIYQEDPFFLFRITKKLT